MPRRHGRDHLERVGAPADVGRDRRLLLFVDPRCLPLSGSPLLPLVASEHDQPRLARHLVAYASDVGGTRESVDVDDEGIVRRVQRYYKPAAWPFIAGVAVSLVPVSSGMLPMAAISASLLELRQSSSRAACRAMTSPIQQARFDLTQESGMLAAVEHSVRGRGGRAWRRRWPRAAAGRRRTRTSIPSPALLGPVVMHAGARIEADATVVGPALIGAGARIGAGAFVAHVAASASTAWCRPEARLRDRVWFASAADDDGRRGAPRPIRSPRSASGWPGRGSTPRSRTRWPSATARRRGAYVLMKRVIDVVVSTSALAVLSPLLLLSRRPSGSTRAGRSCSGTPARASADGCSDV